MAFLVLLLDCGMRDHNTGDLSNFVINCVSEYSET